MSDKKTTEQEDERRRRAEAQWASDEADETKRLGHRPRVTFELVPVVLLRVRGEQMPGNAAWRYDRSVCSRLITATLTGELPMPYRSLGGGAGGRSELHEPQFTDELRAFLLKLDCVEEPLPEPVPLTEDQIAALDHLVLGEALTRGDGAPGGVVPAQRILEAVAATIGPWLAHPRTDWPQLVKESIARLAARGMFRFEAD